MSATEELRRLLDERGVEWSDASDKDVLHTTWNNLNCWFNEFPDGWTAWGMSMRGTPEQAIAATLGSWTCRDVSVDSSTQFYCSECECTVEAPLLWGEINYCPNCGRKVKR